MSKSNVFAQDLRQRNALVDVMKYFTVVKRHGFNTCILHQDMFYIAGIGGAECL